MNKRSGQPKRRAPLLALVGEQATISMKIYVVLAKCKATPDCLGEIHFGVTYAESIYDLRNHLRNFSAQNAFCPICRKTARYSFVDYLAEPFDSTDEQAGGSE